MAPDAPNRFRIVPRHDGEDVGRVDGPVGPPVGHTPPSPYILNAQSYPYLTTSSGSQSPRCTHATQVVTRAVSFRGWVPILQLNPLSSDLLNLLDLQYTHILVQNALESFYWTSRTAGLNPGVSRATPVADIEKGFFSRPGSLWELAPYRFQ